ncbi:MAG: conjugal transfer protein TraB [Chromatiales bacterium]|nr:conjugal transfer protein TraB [Chromatiales bacterium]
MESARAVGRRQVIATLGVVGALVGLVVLGLWLSDPSSDDAATGGVTESARNFRTPADAVDPSAVWISRSEAELRSLHETNEALRRKVGDLEKALERLQARPAPAQAATPRASTPAMPALPIPMPADDLVAPVPRRSGTESLLPPIPPAPPGAPRFGARGGDAPVRQGGILVVDLTPAQKADAKGDAPKAVRRSVRDYLPAGSFARAVLLSGLDAPTGGVASTNPHPVLLRLVDAGTLPNRFRSRVDACFVTAAGYGDIASERAYLRLERLSCVLGRDDIVEAVVRGYVSGEDGKTGLRGRVVSKQGQIIAKSLLVGLAGGIGAGLAQTVTTTSTSALGAVQAVDPERLLQYGLAQGASSALDRVAEWYLQRANETYPIIEIDAGRTVDVVLTEGVDLGGGSAPVAKGRARGR